MTNQEIQDDVSAELRFDPRVEASTIGVAVRAGIVTLSGHVGSYAEKFAAVLAARRVKDVAAVVDDMEVLFMEDKKMADDEIALRVGECLRWDAMLPSTILVTVRHGLVMLSGQVEWHYQRIVAEENVRGLAGVKRVVNNIVVTPTVATADVKNEIVKALRRYADVEAERIDVKVQEGSHVVLQGKVKTWGERAAIENAAWSVRGVQAVDDRLEVVPRPTQLC